MTPDFTAMINQTMPSGTTKAGIIQFTGAAENVHSDLTFAAVLGAAAVAGLVL